MGKLCQPKSLTSRKLIYQFALGNEHIISGFSNTPKPRTDPLVHNNTTRAEMNGLKKLCKDSFLVLILHRRMVGEYEMKA